MAEAGQHPREGQRVIAQMERHRHAHAPVGAQAATPRQSRGDLRRQVSGVVDGAPFAMAPYIRARPRAVATPFADGISLSNNGISPWTTARMPGKYSAPKPAVICNIAARGAR